MRNRIAKVVVGLPPQGPFDYFVQDSVLDKIAEGNRVSVLFNRQRRVGFVVGFKSKSHFKKINPILSVLEDQPALDAQSLKLTKQISEYYGCSWGEAIESYLPSFLRKPNKIEIGKTLQVSPPPSNPSKKPLLIQDSTFSKRWEIIIAKIYETLSSQRKIIFLVPESHHIDTVVSKLKETFPSVKVAGAQKMTSKNEAGLWIQMKKGEIDIVVGTRSTIFAPMLCLGLIVILDEENWAYKQEQTPHYHVETIAHMRYKIENCSVVVISSVPRAEIWRKVKVKKYEKVEFPLKKDNVVQIVDMNNYNPTKTSIISFPLQNNIRQVLEQKGKVVLFMNRRGFSTMTRCNECGIAVKCPRCEVNLTFLYSKKNMVCPRCNFQQELPKICPNCNGSYMRSTGSGIEKLESDVARYYPEARVSLFDKDTKKIKENADIIVATQAILKTLSHLSADLIAVLDFDSELNRFDFRSAYRAFHLVTSLRMAANKKLLVQTYMRDNYCLKALSQMDFNKFYRHELKTRKELQLPPFSNLVAITLRGANDDLTLKQTMDLYSILQAKNDKNIEVSDPHPSVIPKLRDKYRYTLTLKGRSNKDILRFVNDTVKSFKKKRGIVLTMNVDP